MSINPLDSNRPVPRAVDPAAQAGQGPISGDFQIPTGPTSTNSAQTQSLGSAWAPLAGQIQQGMAAGLDRNSIVQGLVRQELSAKFGGQVPDSVIRGVTETLAHDPSLRQLTQQLFAAAGGNAPSQQD